MTAAILARHGLRAGAYLSPHLVSFTERIRVDDARPVRRTRFARRRRARARAAAEKVDRTLEEGDRVTQFEALTAAAYGELAEAGRRRRRRRGRPRRALGRDERDPVARCRC